MKPRVYLGGPVTQEDWRLELVPGLRQLRWAEHYIELPSFTYLGPFYTPERQTCGEATWEYGPESGHLADVLWEKEETGPSMGRKNKYGFSRADLYFTYVTKPWTLEWISEVTLGIPDTTRVVLSVSPDAWSPNLAQIVPRAHRIHRARDRNRLRSDFEFEIMEIGGGLLFGDVT